MLRCRSFTHFFLVTTLSLFLLACGDDSDRSDKPITDYENYRELQLTSLEVTIGDEVVDLVPLFSSQFVGPYSLEVAADVESISLRPTLFDDSNLMEIAKKEIVYEDGEPQKDENGNFVLTSFGEQQIVESGAVDTKTIREGENYIVIRISPRDSNVYLVYNIFVHRPSSNAELVDLLVLDKGFEGDSSDSLSLTPEFDSSVTTYTASAPYHACSIDTVVRTFERHTEVAVNDEPLPHFTRLPLDLAVGENVLTYVSTPETGVGVQTYTVTVTRETPTDEDLAEDATLSSLEFTGAELTRDFRCLVLSYAGLINNSTENVEVVASPVVDGAVMTFGDPIFDINGNLADILNPVELSAGEAHSIDVEVGSDLKIVQVVSANGEVSKEYYVNLTRLTTNRVIVETPEDLQNALLNAQPNDEILLTADTYLGVASEETSGHASAHFFSAANGTEDQPIILRSGISGLKPELSGDADASNTVLLLQGDYWVIQNLQLNDGQTGLVLDGASHNTISGVVVSDVNERGIHIRNGSSNNIVQRSVIVNTGVNPGEGHDDYAEAIVVGSEADDWSTAPEGSLDEKDYDNIIANNLLGIDVRAEAIDVKEGTLRTQIRHNIIDMEGITEVAENASAIVVKGNNTDIAYNSFFNDSGDGLQQMVTLKNVQRDWLNIPWGEDARIFQNSASLGGSQIPLANSTDVISTLVADNTRQDGVEVSYTGAGIDESFTTPKIVIKTQAETPLCLTDAIVEGASYGILEAQECDSSSSQEWLVVHDESGYVFITTDGKDSRVMRPNQSAYFRGWPLAPVEIAGIPDGNNASGFVFRWQTLYSQQGTSFANRGYSDPYVLDSEGLDEEDDLIVLSLNTGKDSQRFIIEEK